MAELVAELRRLGDPAGVDLASRLWCCQCNRLERRSGVVLAGWPRLCRSVACPSCRRWLARSWRDRAADRLAFADAQTCSLVTIMLARCGDLDAVRDAVRDLRVELRNLRDRRARVNRQWRDVQAVGLVELDAVAPHDIPLLPSQRRDVIEALPGGVSDDVVWLPHLHLAISAPHLSHGDVRHALEAQWPGVAGRVDLVPFRDRDAGAGAGGVVAYAGKHQMTTRLLDGVEVAWPLAWQARYWTWLHSMRCGLAPLRVRLGARRVASPLVPGAGSDHKM